MTATTHPTRALTSFEGRAGDHNNRAMAGSAAISAEIGRRLGLEATVVGKPEPALNVGWAAELAAALPNLRSVAERYESIYSARQVPITALSRCAVALATLPVVARHHPDATVLWFDSHADLNTPASTSTGYLGGMALSGVAGLWESGLGGGLATANIVLGGTRDIDRAEQLLIDAGTVRLVRGGKNLLDDLADAIGDSPVYLHLDCDVLEPGIVPTDYHVPHGLDLEDLHGVAEVLARNTMVGVEIGEFEATWQDGGEPFSPDALLDALMPIISGCR